MPDLTDLIARVEAGEGADPCLNKDLLLMLGWTQKDGIAYRPDGWRALHIPDLLISLDDVARLLPEGWGWQTGSSTFGGYARLVGLNEQGISQSHAKTPVRALLAAILRAKAGA